MGTADAAASQLLHGADELLHGARQAVELLDEEGVALLEVIEGLPATPLANDPAAPPRAEAA